MCVDKSGYKGILQGTKKKEEMILQFQHNVMKTQMHCASIKELHGGKLTTNYYCMCLT